MADRRKESALSCVMVNPRSVAPSGFNFQSAFSLGLTVHEVHLSL